MVERIRNIAFTAVVALLLFSAILYQAADALIPGFEAAETSNAEGRDFVTWSDVRENTLVDGSFQDEFEQFAADSIPAKDTVVVTNAALQRFGIASSAKVFGYDVYPTFFDSEYLTSQTDQRILPMPTAVPREGSRPMKNLETWCATLSEAASTHPDTRFVVEIVPQVRQDDTNPAYRYVRGANLMDEEWIQQEWGGRLDDSIVFNVDGIVDREELRTQWFTTDHHWTIERALHTYNDIGSRLGWTPVPYESAPVVQVTPEWYGSDARRALDFEFASTMYDQADDFSSLEFYKISNGQRSGGPIELGKREAFLGGELGSEDIAKYSAYTDYYGNGSAWIENTAQDNGKTCLLIADSFGYGFRRYVAMNYETTITLFPGNGHVGHTVDWFIEEYDVDDVVVITHAQSPDFIANESAGFLSGESED